MIFAKTAANLNLLAINEYFDIIGINKIRRFFFSKFCNKNVDCATIFITEFFVNSLNLFCVIHLLCNV